jgi:hypothetical protein
MIVMCGWCIRKLSNLPSATSKSAMALFKAVEVPGVLFGWLRKLGTPNPADLAQSFVLRGGDAISAALMFTDGGNQCVSVVGTDVLASVGQFRTAQQQRINGQGPYIVSLVNYQVITLRASNAVNVATGPQLRINGGPCCPQAPECETTNPTLRQP